MSYLFNLLLDLLLPQKPLVRELLAMNPAEFGERARRTESGIGKEVIALFDYRDPLVKEAVWMLKYRGNKKIAALLAALLYEEILAFLAEYASMTAFTEPMVIPIPLSPARERERGYNQCNLIVDELLRLDVVSSSSTQLRGGLRWGGVQTTSRNFSVSKTALVKIKETPSQTKTETRKARLKNLKNCFAVTNPALVYQSNIILIDDVATTGATLAEARKTLREAGARKVITFTIAH